MVHTFEDREIRGITIKLARTMIVGCFSLALLGSGAWYSLKEQVHDVGVNNETSNQIQDISIKAIQQQLDQFRLDIKLQNTAITRQDIELERIKERLGIH